MDFKLFDVESLGSQVGATISLDVTVTHGLFTVPLNDSGQFGPQAFDGNERWLEITIDGTPITPRQPLTAAPHAEFARTATALRAAGSPTDAALVDSFGGLVLGTGSNLQKLDSGGVSRSLLQYDESDNFQILAPPDRTLSFRTGTGGFTSVRATLTAGGRVGIGTAAPDVLVHLQSGTPGDSGTVTASNLLLERSSDNYLTFLSPANRLTGLAFGRPGSTSAELIHGGITYNESTSLNSMQFKTGGNLTRMTINAAGDVGIGTTTPLEPLHVVHVSDATLCLERPGGAIVAADAVSSAGSIGTSNAFPFRLTTNGAARVTVSSTGLVGINTTTPAGRLHVVDVAGGNGSVILPASSISAAEILDEPGCAGMVYSGEDIPISAAFPDPPESVLSHSITAPAAGFVLAIATIGSRQVSLGAANVKWGLTTNPSSLPADALMIVEFQPVGAAGLWGMPVTLHRLFPVSAGTTTVHIMAQAVFGSSEFGKAQLSLVFLPSSYGTTPTAGEGGETAASGMDPTETPNAEEIAGLVELLRAERAELREEMESLRRLKAELEAQRSGSVEP